MVILEVGVALEEGGGWQNQGSSNFGIVCHYCGKIGHIAAQYYAKRDDIRSGKLQQGNYASSSR